MIVLKPIAQIMVFVIQQSTNVPAIPCGKEQLAIFPIVQVAYYYY